MRMSFGKFKGVQVAELPHHYISWLLNHNEFMDELLRRDVEREFLRRLSTPDTQDAGPEEAVYRMASTLIDTGYRTLALKHHPDHNGTTATMQTVNAAADFLRDAAQQADRKDF